MLGKILLTSLAVFGAANAQRSLCSATTNVVQSQADLDALSTCTTLSGSLVFGPDLVQAQIDGIRTIRGDLIIANALLLQSLTAPQLASIEGKWNMTSLTVLNSLTFSSLRSVGEIYWQTLPALSSLNLPAVVTQADRVTITDTILESLEGINLVTVQRFNINNNRYLKEVRVQLANVTDGLAIEFNSPKVAASFPNLTWANNATFRSCGDVQLPLLATVNGSIGFFENAFTSLQAPRLTAVGTGTEGGDVTFANNNNLGNVSMPQLATIFGTLQFVNNSKVDDITGFPKLSVVHGSIDISGEFEQAEFPAIRDVRGGFNLQTAAKFDCSEFDKIESGVVKGKYVCSGAVVNPGTEGTNPTTNGNGSGGKKNSAGRFTVSTSLVAMTVLAMLTAFL
ncbi:hypothetical protein DRE_04842 [Drechslerella stenobrocha 248]|uniref:Uncharacterized protein n=1 Tax=Drechslerella stenobrocha 248 TaxID=1043628 RepID=W7I9V4_9PEZI|nr:hypothetical protein DRE_04842 [Drechslerella stenobrocha 248]